MCMCVVCAFPYVCVCTHMDTSTCEIEGVGLLGGHGDPRVPTSLVSAPLDGLQADSITCSMDKASVWVKGRLVLWGNIEVGP